MKPFSEYVEENFRHGLEFIMRSKPYTERDLLGKDYLTFLKILKECENEEKKAVERIERGG